MMNTNYPMKKKATNEKEIIDFFTMMEDKFENNAQKLNSFVEIFNKYNNSNEEEILVKLRDILADYPVLILELNKMLPKMNRVPIVDQENADKFFIKVKEKDEFAFRELLRAILSFKKGELSQDKLISRYEELLGKFPDLLEEAYLFLDYKRISSAAYKKNLMNKLAQTRGEVRRNGVESKSIFMKLKDSMATPIKIQSNPEFLFFDSLKNIFDPVTYNTIMKLLHLYNEGVLNHTEFVELTEPYFEGATNTDLFDYLKTLTYSKMMNRRQFSLINKPLSEIDLTKCQRIGTSYYELPREYPNLICSGRNEETAKTNLNDRLISIPAGSEDDKNPLKKNHYEEHIFKFEDQRYEVDMIIEILKFAVDELNIINERVVKDNLESVDLDQVLGSSTTRFITFFYKEYSSQVLQGIKTHPRDAIPIVINRFKKRIEEAQNQKVELEKNIKLSFDRFYYKSFDHRSFKLKNFEKKSNNSKAFIKEMSMRKKEKMVTSNSNILKGGIDNFEFFYSINLKYAKENINKIVKSSDDEILLKDFDQNSILSLTPSDRKKLPEMKIIIDNLEIFKITITLIFYQIYFSNQSESKTISDTLTQIFENLFQIGVKDLPQAMYAEQSAVAVDKDFNYIEIIDKIKNKTVENKDLDKIYNLEALVKYINDALSINNLSNDNFPETTSPQKDTNPDNHSVISLTPSLQSQDTGKTYKDVIIRDEGDMTSERMNNTTEASSTSSDTNPIFIPDKNKNHVLFFANENCFVLVRFIFCIYERINKLYEYSLTTTNEQNFYTNPGAFTPTSTPTPLISHNEIATFKNFIIIYKALIHKKIENTSVYEELCRDILGNESYFLFNLDKLINSLIKTTAAINNDPLSKEIINLFLHEKKRKNTVCQSLYYSNFTKLCDTSNSCYRMLYSDSIKAMTIHLCEFSNDVKKEYFESFKDFFDNVLQESYQKLEEENMSQDEPFTLFLKRNKKLMSRRRNCLKPAVCQNNLLFRVSVDFDYASKKVEFLKSGTDVLYFNKPAHDKNESLKKIFMKNLMARIWNDSKVSGK